MNICTNVNDTIDAKRLNWYGHVCLMGNDRWPEELLDWIPPEGRKRGRPRNGTFGRQMEMKMDGRQKECNSTEKFEDND